ncbi:PQQ-dependent dehydrogenase, methanol/ethanol family [Flavilitoribacter nigricans]|uniref:PQQ-dependent dehydrogenase, methanol/ethanol family n=1 Tax=Flavilitoribacter nigricans (strain ATCC 23147 / DSM 23189 / NBRC 102662 / NCIMB 1420 / SS-2) TaxID=1122177 RepID=A0A2D0N2B0_FLAN2|nr:PQQ-dependent dehydrogenase, methanol/ethanol family [Flavilitoribacter nigricans]PHN02526.1 PQQ-dependent dehydrogenase, methanol/ethanol family [Flavilitoribacter nigricans DSM 23189 = NBRC 102662]
MNTKPIQHLLALLLLFSISSCDNDVPVQPRSIDDLAIADESNTSDWLAYGRTHSEQRFSPLADINTDNVSKLQVDWYLDLPRDVGLVSTPLVVDGVLYFTGTMNVVRAVNATSGELIWEYDPEVGKAISKKRQIGWVHNRGLTFYNGKVFAATWDGRLIAIDAETGAEIWTAVTFDPQRSLYITGAPKAFAGKVLIGNGGTENGPTRGFVTAYDAETGEEAWKFYIVPGDPAKGFENKAMQMAAKTWTGEWWKHGGGGNAWHGFTYDEELDVLYIGTGNGSPWNRKIRSPEGGDNLFLCSIVALNPHTGEYLWHYQTTPGETWDYNSNMDIVLADLTIDGEPIKAILHAPKNGFFYVINRETGKLISAEPFADVNWATHIDTNTGKPVEAPNARYENGPVDIAPNPWGAHTWHAMSYNPQTGLAYIPTLHQSVKFSDESFDLASWQAVEFSGGIGVNMLAPDRQPRDYPASLQAWDPVRQKLAWSVPQDHFWNAGTLTTAGNLVFQGRSDGKLLAYDARTGETRWTFDVGLGISAPPITYQLNGKQYLVLLVGFGGGYARGGWEAYKLGWAYRQHTRRLLAFSLDGTAEVPALAPPYFPKPIVDAEFVIEEAKALQGATEYWKCFNCHGSDMYAGGMAPDLRASSVPLNQETFASVVRDGSLNLNGMPAFPEITDEQLEALRHFIRHRAKQTLPEYEELIAGKAHLQ